MKSFPFSKQFFFKILITFSLVFFLSGKELEETEIPDSPLSLTAGDGAGLVLKGYESNTVLDGFIAFTEIKLKFYNPENRQREGRFRITLPDNAHLARFAMQIDGRWQEGEVVEKEKAVRAYEDFLHRKQDPALLESDAGNEFSARIFPIPAKGDKDLIVSYSTVLDTNPPQYTIPLVGLPEIENFKVTVLYDEKEFQQENQKSPSKEEGNTVNRKVFSIQKKNYKPERDYGFEHKTKGNLYLKNDSMFALHFVPFKETSSEKFKEDKAVFLIDTSASAAIRYKEHLDKLEDVIKKLALKEVHIFGFDNKLTYYGDSAQDLKKLEKVIPLGASNLHSALKGISAKADVKDARLILVSDGVATAGIIEKAKIAELVKSQKWISRLDFIVPGTYKDAGLIKKIIPLGKNPGTSVELGDELDAILKKLNRKVHTDNKISIPGVKWFYPDTLDSLQPGDPVVVFGELKDKDGNPTKDIQFNGKALDAFTSLTMDELLLERETIAARINRLIDLSEKEQNEDTAKGFELQARELSIKHRIQSPYTSFLVLETEADYARFQITRNSLTNILTIGVGGLEVINRRNAKNYEFISEEKIEEARRAKQAEENRVTKNTPKKKSKGKKAEKPSSANGSLAMNDGDDDIDEEEPRRANKMSEKEVSDKMEPARKPSVESKIPSGYKDMDAKKMDLSESGKSSVTDNKPESKTEEPKIETTVVRPKPAPDKNVIPSRDEIEPLPEREKRRLESIRRPPPRPRPEPEEKHEKIEPYTGNMKKFQSLLDKKETKKAYQFALDWRMKSPDDALALIALGDAFDKLGDKPNTIRAYTSLVDYFPKRADIRRWAGEKLMSIGEYDDAIDTLSHALTQRPDHPSSYHLLAIAYIKDKQYKNAAGVILKGLNYQFDGRFGAVHEILYDDLDLAYSLVMKTDSKDKEYFTKIKSEYKIKQLTKEIRFVLVWETDANDVDFHIYDKDGNHAFYSAMELASGGALYADLTGGYGPECFRIINPLAFPYKLEAHYYSRGPMGYGMGAVQIIRYDGEKTLNVDTRDYVIMNDGAFLDLGVVKE